MSSAFAPPPARHRRAESWLDRLSEALARVWRRAAAPAGADDRPRTLTKREAIARAIATVPQPVAGLRTWVSADATLLRGVWLCLLEDEWTVFIVGVSTHTAQAHVAAEGPRRRGTRPRRGGRRAPRVFRCSQARGCPPIDRFA